MTIRQLEAVIDAHGKELYSFCVYLTGSRGLADELYQDTFLKATEQMERLEEDGNLKSYLLSVALRLWKNRKRKYAWRRRIAPEEPLFEETEGDASREMEDLLEDCLKREQREMVQKAVAGLDEKYRIPVLLYYMEGMPLSQVAEVMKLPVGTVKSRMSTARKRLEAELEEYVNG